MSISKNKHHEKAENVVDFRLPSFKVDPVKFRFAGEGCKGYLILRDPIFSAFSFLLCSHINLSIPDLINLYVCEILRAHITQKALFKDIRKQIKREFKNR